MFIKRFLTRLWENKTGRKCSRCKYNVAGHCTHPSWTSLCLFGGRGYLTHAGL